ncbi:VPS9 domain protein [Cladophialophora carrionii]|uniref:VPS9 domain protein n=1 Tax=Cladophialophora carrionii TaxID=86049 RepID=A0A1C1CRK5_9EURO|nr:VPS9 domain protein [Cladophialophora carrionii]
MSRNVSTGSLRARPSALSTKSFTRYEPSLTSPTSATGRSRASTIQSVTDVKSPKKVDASPEDIFDKSITEENEPPSPDLGRSNSLPERFDELPIELASLCDRFVESLSAKVYNEPPAIDQLAELFQEFYARASGAVSIHIATLRSRLNRGTSPTPSKAGSRTRAAPSKSSPDSLGSGAGRGGAQQMLTASEVTERRKQRKLLEYKRIVLEEAVEKRVCEKVYDKIWRHKSTLDEVRDEKLRSKTAALALVGIGLKDLGIELSEDSGTSAEDVQASLAPARESLAKMNDERYPLGKLQHLTTAHKAVVDTLSSIHSSSSSADEILPTLIYTLITSPIEGINVISNLQFIQRFRAAPRIDGEAAYCLTNLEAAITFLEDVDLASLREDEKPEGPTKTQAQSEGDQDPEKLEAFPPLPGTAPAPSTPTTATSTLNATGTAELSPAASVIKDLPEKSTKTPSTRHQRTLSDLLQPITNANEAVRSTAEEGFKNISNTLDNSLKFFLGKLKERGSEGPNTEVVVPKTLDEARQLVSRPLTPDEDDHALSESSSMHDGQTSPMPSNLTKTEEKLLGLLGGRKAAIRERSVDSIKSNASAGGKRAGFLAATTNSPPNGPSVPGNAAAAPAASSSNPLETVKNFGNSLNPMGSLGSAFGSAFGRFGARPSASPPSVPPTSATPTIVVDKDAKTTMAPTVEEAKPPKTTNEVPLKTPNKTELAAIRAAPPIPRFLLLGDASDLRLGEVQDLLDDYQRLARVLGRLVQRAQNEGEDEAELEDQEDLDVTKG